MLRTSLRILLVGGVCLLASDIEIFSLDPWGEFTRMLSGAIAPDVSALWSFRDALLNTVTFAFCGITLGIIAGAFLALLFDLPGVRMACAFVRAVHEIFWAFLFLPVLGLGPLNGVMAIAVPYAGVFAKVFAEIFQEADRRPWLALPASADPLSRFLYGMLPVTWSSLKHYAAYRFECALRSSAVLGFIGLPTVGFHLETAFREGMYAEAAALLYALYLVIASLGFWLRPRWTPICAAASFLLLVPDLTFRLDNVGRFFYEILPWPMRRAGFVDGTTAVEFSVPDLLHWSADLAGGQVLPGLANTVILTQVVLAATMVCGVLAAPLACRHLFSRPVRGLGNLLLIVLRTTPEYILAYVFVQLWGPSMLPAIVAIALHNGAILGHLSGHHAGRIPLRTDAPRRRSDRYAFELLPRVYGQFLAFLFYRWEIIARESAILGILGIHTLGFFVDSAFAEDKLDVAVILIGVTALLNVVIDTLSQRFRRANRLTVTLSEVPR